MSRTNQWALAAACLVLGASTALLLQPNLVGHAREPETSQLRDVTSFREVARKVLPAVVSIESRSGAPTANKMKGRVRKKLPGLENLPEEFRKHFEGMEPFEIPDMPDVPHQGFGSGVIIDPKGVILTNHHVVAGAAEVVVQLHDGRKFTTKDFVSDPKTDLAIVRVKADDLPWLEMGDSDAMEVGDRVLAAGAPFGLTGSLTSGIVSAKGRNGLSMNMYEDFIQTDAAINPGNSGGPLVNLQGQVIGINSAIKSRSGGFQGVGLAIASNLAKGIKDQLLKDGVVRRGYLGVQIKDLVDEEVAERLGVRDRQGVLVSTVYDGSPASKAGVQNGDVITSIDGKPVKEGRELQRIVASLPLEKPVELNVVRDGKPVKLKVTILEQPREFGAVSLAPGKAPEESDEATAIDKVGIEVAELTPALAEQFGWKKETKGVVVTGVEEGGMAHAAGLQRGTLILKVDKQAVATADGLKESLEKASLDKGVLLQVQTPQGGTGYVLLKKS